jgi:hypothetical protein
MFFSCSEPLKNRTRLSSCQISDNQDLSFMSWGTSSLKKQQKYLQWVWVTHPNSTRRTLTISLDDFRFRTKYCYEQDPKFLDFIFPKKLTMRGIFLWDTEVCFLALFGLPDTSTQPRVSSCCLGWVIKAHCLGCCQTLTTMAMSILIVDNNVDHLTLTMSKVTRASWKSLIDNILTALSAVLCVVWYRPHHVLRTGLTFGDLRLGSLFIIHMHGEITILDVYGSMQIGIAN